MLHAFRPHLVLQNQKKKKILQFNSMKQANTHVKNKMSKEMAVEGDVQERNIETLKHFRLSDVNVLMLFTHTHSCLCHIQH